MDSYSAFNPIILDKKTRLQKAKQIWSILDVHLKGQDIKKFKVLDIGCSSGVIANYLVEHFNLIYGIDTDPEAIKKAKQFSKKNVRFQVMDGTKTKFSQNSFDLVVCNQVYVLTDQKKLIKEIHRILKPRGICLLTGRNKFKPVYVNNFDTSFLSFWQLKNLCHRFIIHYYTPKIIHNPKKFGFMDLARFQFVLSFFIKIRSCCNVC